MRKLQFIKADPIGKVLKDGDNFTITIGKTDFSIKLAVRNYWLLYGKEDLAIHIGVNTEKRIVQELMRYPVKIGLVGEKNEA